MTDALKAAVQQAINDTTSVTWNKFWLDEITSALARRGVVVMTETQKELKNDLIDSIDLALHAILNNKYASPGIKALAEDAHGEIHDLAGILSDEPEIRSATVAEIGPDNCASVALPESPAPKPARKVVQISACISYAMILCNDGTMFIQRPGSNWSETSPVPQPGDK
jgi:hypothetical protein